MKAETPPHSTEVEKAVLGALLLDSGVIHEVKELQTSDFYHADHAEIFKAILDLHEEGSGIDAVIVAQRVNGLKDLVFTLAGDVVTTANIRMHVRLLQEHAFKRVVLSTYSFLKSNLHAMSTDEISEHLAKIPQTLDLTGGKHRDVSLSREVDKWISLTDGDFSLTECYTALQNLKSLTNTYTKNNLHQIFHRLSKKGTIQKSGNKNGVYRRVDDAAEEIDWWNAESKPLALKFPLDVLDHVAVYPKNIVIIAGEPNAGKTAFLLNVARLNKDLMQVTYLSSEMGAIELKTRLSKFDAPLLEWKKVRFKDRSSNFADVIDPDNITIIDFLEITEDFYRIAALIKEIYDKLNHGVCIIAIQKNRNTDIGRGGQLGLEKARLYLAMESGKLKIVKAKAWAKEGINPNGLIKKFKLVQGSKFIDDSPWQREDERI